MDRAVSRNPGTLGRGGGGYPSRDFAALQRNGRRKGKVILRKVELSAIFLFVVMLPLRALADEDASPTWEDVFAIFSERCVMCHSEVAGASKGLRLDSYEATITGSEKGPVLVPGNPEGSELIKRLRGDSLPRMPFLSRPLPEEQLHLIETWIRAGVPN